MDDRTRGSHKRVKQVLVAYLNSDDESKSLFVVKFNIQ